MNLIFHSVQGFPCGPYRAIMYVYVSTLTTQWTEVTQAVFPFFPRKGERK